MRDTRGVPRVPPSGAAPCSWTAASMPTLAIAGGKSPALVSHGMRALADAGGTRTNTYTYDAFGTPDQSVPANTRTNR